MFDKFDILNWRIEADIFKQKLECIIKWHILGIKLMILAMACSLAIIIACIIRLFINPEMSLSILIIANALILLFSTFVYRKGYLNLKEILKILEEHNITIEKVKEKLEDE